MRATAQDRDAAMQMGVDVNRVNQAVFGIAAALGGVSGLLVGMYYNQIDTAMSLQATLKGVVAEVIGGAGNVPGAVVGSLVLGLVESSLGDDKAQDPTVIDLAGKTTLADFMVVATGTSQRHIAAMAENLVERLKAAGHVNVHAEGLQAAASTWILIDAGDVLVHLFRAETRAFYDIEKLWSVAPPRRAAASAAS